MAGLYVHIPFCEHKCIYCDFYSIAPSEEKKDEKTLQEAFVRHLLTELSVRRDEHPSAGPFETVFFGGGTPSLLDAEQASAILDTLWKTFPITDDAEVTLEANPGTVTREKLRTFRSMGFTRVSFGVQSFQRDELSFLTRIHSAEQAARSVEDAREAGFDNLSIDLMFGLPGQTLESWMDTLQRALALSPDHISCYSLTVEQNTPLARMVSSGQVMMLDRNIDADLYERTIGYLEERGYGQYEVSNFCRPGRQSLHNLNYWNHGEYLGFGPSAHSYVGGVRWWNSANLSTYGNRLAEGSVPIEGSEVLTEEQLKTERIFLGLRGPGLDLERYEQRFGRSFLDEQKERVDSLIGEGFAAIRGPVLALTRRGYMVCDDICASLS